MSFFIEATRRWPAGDAGHAATDGAERADGDGGGGDADQSHLAGVDGQRGGNRVERCQGMTCANFVQIATPPGTSYADTGLAPSTPYRYQVRAAGAAGNLSGYSNVASATTSTPAAATLTTLSPSSAGAGAPAFTLTVNGTGFASGAIVHWNGAPKTTTFGSSTQLTAAIPASDIAAAGTSPVTVVNPGAAASNALTFTITPPPASSFTLNVSRSGPGTVTSSPAGINCGADCSESYAAGSVVTLRQRRTKMPDSRGGAARALEPEHVR